ncbi:MAG TPA: 7-cyano-7-deazaguanine synthase [Terriglobales bacterium]|nr:7-cyano-7-deazaguanine synthase [Terriglobales bacterium]
MRPIEISNEEFRFDFTDLVSVQWAHASESSHQESGPHAMEFYIDDETIDRRFGHALDALLADWVDLALACYLADRLATRKPSRLAQSGKHWSRTLNITLPVRRLDRWTDEIQGSLSRLLSFLTDDSWRFEFVQREGAKRAAESQRFLFPFEHGSPTRVALYSGGLDSFAGAAQILYDSPDYNYIFVSGVTNPRQQAGQRAQLNRLRLKTSAHICHVAIPYGLHWAGNKDERKEEPSQRTRGFLFLTLGTVSAIAAGTKELFLYENGVGAINLPYDGTQVGTYNSRATHPSTLLRMEDFTRALIGQEFSIVNPFLFFTKAEMCRHVAVQEVGELLALTFSCDGFPVRAKNRGQCGSCTSCLLRRQAIELASLARYDQNGYLNDLCSPTFAGSDNQLHALRAMNWQAHRIGEAVSRVKPWEALVSEFIELQTVELDLCRNGKLRPAELQSKVVHLYSQYAAEWESFSARRHCDVRKRIA